MSQSIPLMPGRTITVDEVILFQVRSYGFVWRDLLCEETNLPTHTVSAALRRLKRQQLIENQGKWWRPLPFDETTGDRVQA